MDRFVSRVRESWSVSKGAVVAGLAVLLMSAAAVAQSVSVQGKGSNGFPVPIGATGDRLKVEASLVSADGGALGTVRVDPTGTTAQPARLVSPDGGLTGVAEAPLRVDPTGTTAQPVWIASPPDGGVAVKLSGSQNLPLLQGGPNGTLISEGFALKPTGCVEAIASTVGDGGTLTVSAVAPNSRYVLSVDENSAVRIAQGVPCVGYASGTGVGIPIPSGSVIAWKAYAGADGGVPVYTLCAQTATSTTPIVTLCPSSP